MYEQVLDPIGNLAWSAAVAALPLVALFKFDWLAVAALSFSSQVF